MGDLSIAELGALGEFIGAVLLFISLIYVGLQIRQSNRAERLSATIAFENQYRQNLELWAATPELADVIARGLSNLQSLTESEIHLFGPRIYAFYRHVETAWEYHQQGLIDDAVLDKTLRVLTLYHNDPGAIDWYKSHGERLLSLEFRAFLEDYFANQPLSGAT